MAQLFARRARDGIIQRLPDPSDRHCSLVKLSEKAKRRLPAGRAILRQSNADMTKVVQLLDLLGRVLENVEQIES